MAWDACRCDLKDRNPGRELLEQCPHAYQRKVLAVREVRALSDFDNVTVRIADVTARLTVLGDRLRDEFGSSTLPQFVARLNIRDAQIHKAVDVIRVGDAEHYRRLVRGGPTPHVYDHPDIREP